ncbi:hypothetical protein BBN63_32345 [Streptomyces niveus]|uniref:Uncharacterized protein n=1 Tax=Streptomyces niveus TaxID=193462 RepID=A0A1U9R0Z9_STRNV|nr:hypothetical protein BBN63_32345 [Streptomyces niveus]
MSRWSIHHPARVTVRAFSSSTAQSSSSQVPSVTSAVCAAVISWWRERSPQSRAFSGPSSGGMSNRWAQARAASCSSARRAASHSSLPAPLSRAAFQQSVQSRAASQRVNAARLSAGRFDRSWVIS